MHFYLKNPDRMQSFSIIPKDPMKRHIIIYLLFFSFPVIADFTHAENYYNQAEYTKSFNEYHKLAKLGNIRAQYRIALMLFDGIGVKKNTVKAYAWSRTAGSSKSSTKELSDKIAKTLSSHELVEANTLSNKFISNYGIIATKKLLGPLFAEIENPDFVNSNDHGTHRNANYNKLSLTSDSQTKMKYPKKARKKGTRGWVELYFNIHPNGTVHDISILQQYPHELFAPAAVEFLQNLTFEFYMDNDRVIPDETLITSRRFKFGEEGRSGLVGRKTKRKINEIYKSAVKGNIEDKYHYTNLFYSILNKTGLVNVA